MCWGGHHGAACHMLVKLRRRPLECRPHPRCDVCFAVGAAPTCSSENPPGYRSDAFFLPFLKASGLHSRLLPVSHIYIYIYNFFLLIYRQMLGAERRLRLRVSSEQLSRLKACEIRSASSRQVRGSLWNYSRGPGIEFFGDASGTDSSGYPTACRVVRTGSSNGTFPFARLLLRIRRPSANL